MEEETPEKSGVQKAVDWFKEQVSANKDRSSVTKMIVNFILSALSVVILGYVKYKQTQVSGELAKLQTEKDLAEERANLAMSSLQTQIKQNKIVEHKLKVAAAKQKVALTNEKLELVAKLHDTIKDNINALQNWKDIEDFERSLGTTSNSTDSSSDPATPPTERKD
jgi:hypothetical protein